MDKVFILLHLTILIFFVLYHTQADNEIGKARQKRFWCNPWTGLYRTKCRSRTKIGENTYRKCGWWGKRRCRSGTKYSWKTTYKRCYKRCKVDGVWSGWSSWRSWGACTGGICFGVQRRYKSRSCTSPSPKNGGKNCRGSGRQWSTRACKVAHSTVNGNWGSWGQWKAISACSKTCDSGQQHWTRQRTCSNPSPRCGGKLCQGSSNMNRYTKCFIKKCNAVDGKWSGWGNWGHFRHCSETCGHGVRYRYRYRECNNPEPQHGGKKCPGSLKDEEFKRCFLRKCPKLRVKGNQKKKNGKTTRKKLKYQTTPKIVINPTKSKE